MDVKHAESKSAIMQAVIMQAVVRSLDELPVHSSSSSSLSSVSRLSSSYASLCSSSSSSSVPLAPPVPVDVAVPRAVPPVVPNLFARREEAKCSEAVRQFAMKFGLPTPTELGNHRRIMKWVPNAVKRQWRELCSVVLSRYVQADRRHDVEAKLRALVEFLLLPQQALVHAHGGRKRLERDLAAQHRRALARMSEVPSVAASAAPSSSSASSSSSSSSDAASELRPPADRDWSDEAAARAEAAKVRRAVGLIRLGYIKRAARTLAQPITAPITSDVLVAKMKELHPLSDGKAVPVLPGSAPVVICEANDSLARHLRKICNGSGPGESGMTFDHLRVLADDQTCMDGLACLMRDVLNEHLDPRFKEYLLASRGLGIEKGGGGVRPIAIGEAVYRAAVSYVLYPAMSDAAQILQPVNLGCGTEGGAEIVVACVQHFLRTRDVGVFVGDFQNAFNTVSRQRMMQELFAQPKLGKLWRVAHWAYSQPSLVMVRDRQGELVTVVRSEQGVRQGDPLASLLFCLAVAGVYKTAAAAGKDVVPLAFMDDIHLMGAPEEVMKSAAVLEAEGVKIGLTLRAEKSKFVIYRSSVDLSASVVGWLGRRKVQMFTNDARDDAAVAEILGVPVSEDSKAVAKEVKKVVAGQRVFFDSLLHTAMPTMLAMLMLRISGVPRMNYLVRCSPVECVQEGAKEFDQMVMETAVTKLQIPNDEVDAAKIRLAMPVSPIGGGLRSAAATAPEAYLASQAQAAPFLQKLTKQAGPAPGSPSHVALVAAVASVLSAAPAVQEEVKEGKELKEEVDAVAADAKDGVRSLLPPGRDASARVVSFWQFFSQNKEKISGLQRKLTGIREERELKQEEVKLSPAQMALFRSSKKQGANAWCSDIPGPDTSLLSDAHYITAMRLHLGLPLSAVLPVSCACGKSVSVAGYHLLHCNTFRGNSVSVRHHRLVQVLALHARRAGAVVEVEKLVDEDGQRIDLLLHFADRSLMVDVTVRNPAAPSIVGRAAGDEKAAARAAEADKARVYEGAARRAGHRLITFTVDVTGALSEAAQLLIDDVVRHYQEGVAMDPDELDPMFRQRLVMDVACALQRGNGDVVASGLMCARAAESGRVGGRGRWRLGGVRAA